MEHRKICNNKFKLNQDEKLIRKFDYNSFATASPQKKSPHLDLGVHQGNRILKKSVQKVLVTIKQTPPTVKSIYFDNTRKVTDRSSNLLGVGDHQTIQTVFSNKHHAATPIVTSTDQISSKLITELNFTTENEDKKCYVRPRRTQEKNRNSKAEPSSTSKTTIKVNLAKAAEPINTLIIELHQRIRKLEKKRVREAKVVDPNMSQSSSDDENKDIEICNLVSKRAGCSYIEHYSHIPESGAFQRRLHQAGSHTPSKSIDKEHNSEQYSRDFTTYDGITARGHRHSESVPCKHEDGPRVAAERVHKMRHKLNPVRDYRLMDTVHYLAQGEFAPRDDGIKLTPSREAVLSDIIYEDVCRTHWPNTRLSRRQRDRRCCELQRLIDSMLRERVAHVERRRRRHYRIVKLNHRHDSCSRALGKTGDIIVASHKHKSDDNEREVTASDRIVDSINSARRRTETVYHRRSVRSNREERRNYESPRCLPDECSPGPSNAVRNSVDQNTDCYYNSYHPDKNNRGQPVTVLCTATSTFASGSSVTCQPRHSARLLVKKEPLARRRTTVEEPNLEHYILLPTLVPRTQSNLKRQKKFNKLYQRILSAEERTDETQVCREVTEPKDRKPKRKVQTRDIGLNINVNLYEDDKILS